MRARCYKPYSISYPNYGGRGITVCQRWLDSVANFIEDMGERPPGTTLDRIDNDGNYEPSNCRWATPKEQSANQRRRRMFCGGFRRIGTILKYPRSYHITITLRGGNYTYYFRTLEEAEEFQTQLSYEREFQRHLEHLHLDSSSGLLVSKASG